MTVKENLLRNLIDRGLFPNQAAAIFQRALPELEPDDYRTTWDSDESAYPNAMYAIWLLVLDRHALAWIDENAPHAWFRPMFTPDPEKEIARLRAERSGS